MLLSRTRCRFFKITSQGRKLGTPIGSATSVTARHIDVCRFNNQVKNPKAMRGLRQVFLTGRLLPILLFSPWCSLNCKMLEGRGMTFLLFLYTVALQRLGRHSVSLLWQSSCHSKHCAAGGNPTGTPFPMMLMCNVGRGCHPIYLLPCSMDVAVFAFFVVVVAFFKGITEILPGGTVQPSPYGLKCQLWRIFGMAEISGVTNIPCQSVLPPSAHSMHDTETRGLYFLQRPLKSYFHGATPGRILSRHGLSLHCVDHSY